MLFGLLLLFFIGKIFYKLAEKYEKNKWGFAVIGIVTYYAGTFITALIYGIIYFMMYPDASDESVDTMSLKLTVVVFGLLSCVVLHYVLENNWKKAKKLREKDRIHEIGTKDSSEE